MPIKILGSRDNKYLSSFPKSLIINVTSSSKNWSKELSPFFLGPVKLYDDFTAQKMENAWQYSKVYSEHIGENGKPNEKYWKWAVDGWNDKRANRYPMGKGRKPEYSYWNGEMLDRIESRKKIYIPLYSELVKNTDAFERLKLIYEVSGDIILWDFDGYDHKSLEMSWDDVINNENKSLGHAFIIAMLLEGYLK